MNLPFEWSAFWSHQAVRDYAMVLGCVLVVGIFLKVYAVLLSRRLRVLAASTATYWDDIAVQIIDRAVTPLLLAGGLYAVTHILSTHSLFTRISEYALAVVFTWYLALAVILFLDHAAESYLTRKREDEEPFDPTVLQNARFVIRLVAWMLGGFVVLTNLGYNITSLVAGFGIGGIAIALAVQNILGDLFSYVTILVDKPFVIGDFIIAGTEMGTVENIGIKSTRLRTLSGPELVISNRDLTSARVQNFRKMTERRIVFHVGVRYDTGVELLKRVPEIVRGVLESVPGVRFDRCILKALGAYSLDIEIAYVYPTTHEFNDYLVAQDRINLGLLEAFAAAGIGFAFPTQTLHVAKPA